MKLYLAGPDVFLPDVEQKSSDLKRLCREHGFHPLFPLDNRIPEFKHDHGTAARIYQANITMIRAADAILANISPFRGVSADPGTIYEIGFGEALGKAVAIYTYDQTTYLERCRNQITLTDTAGRIRDESRLEVENFGLVDNLMFTAIHRVYRSPREALLALSVLHA